MKSSLFQAADSTLDILNRLAAPLEKLVEPQDDDKLVQHPPVFIVGPPRSGTTLLYQILCHRWYFGYFTNLTAWCYRVPILASKLEQFLRSREKHQKAYRFHSNYGRTHGMFGPNEGGRFWYRWFPRGDRVYVPPQITPEEDLQELRTEIAGMSAVASASMLFKNVYNSMRIAPILEAMPHASFLVCYRDPVEIAQSILIARRKFLGNKVEWWSLPPRQISEIKDKPYWMQIVDQIYFTYQQIDEDRNRFGSEKFLDVSYHGLCEDPEATLAEVTRFFSTRGIDVKIRGQLPSQFSASRGQRVDDKDYQLITNYVTERWATNSNRLSR